MERIPKRIQMNLPANEFIGLYGKIWLWKHANLKLAKFTILNVELCEFCELHSISTVRMWREHDGRWQDVARRTQVEGLWGGFCFCGGFAYVVQFRVLGTRARFSTKA